MKNYQRGVSFIETLIAIGVFTFAVLAINTLMISFYRAYSFSFEQIAAINEARKGVETMVREIRESKTAEDGSYPLVEAGDSTFTFYGDIDRDGTVERVRYFLDGINFKKGVIEPSGDPPQYPLASESVSILSQFVRSSAGTPIFTYYNGDWPADTVNNPLPTLTRLTDTKLMHIYLKVNVDPARPPDDFELESDTQIRNLKTNL